MAVAAVYFGFSSYDLSQTGLRAEGVVERAGSKEVLVRILSGPDAGSVVKILPSWHAPLAPNDQSRVAIRYFPEDINRSQLMDRPRGRLDSWISLWLLPAALLCCALLCMLSPLLKPASR